MIEQIRLRFFVHTLAFFISWGCATNEPIKSDTDSPSHHTPKGFTNPHYLSRRGLSDFLKWQLGLGPHELPALSPDEIPPYPQNMAEPDLHRIKNPDPDQIQITWVGHSTFLIQMDGINLLTDPVFNDRASPFSFGGIKRLVPPGMKFEDLPPIDAVLISHNHYDHLDEPTVKRLGNKPKYFVPLGLARWFRKREIDHVLELDWWQSTSFRGLKSHSVPIQHFSGRSPFDRNETLWSGWIVEGKKGEIFFAGDTGYSPVFKEIGKRFGPMSVSIIPIGAYQPRWFMKPVHVNPPEAVRIHQDINSQLSIASHWGTFKLSDEPIGEPPPYLKKALKEMGIDEDDFLVMKFGETRSFQQ